MTRSERERTYPSYVAHMHAQGQKLRTSAILFLLRAVSRLSIQILEYLLIRNDGTIQEFATNEIKNSNPQFLIASPGNMRNCKERVWLRECKLMKIPTAIFILSWDNPTTKGAFLEKPDVVFVQSDSQYEAVLNQGFSPNQIRVVGSVYSERLLGIPPQMPKSSSSITRVIYLGSSSKTSKNQNTYIDHVMSALESYSSCDYELNLRPHPENPFESSLLHKIRDNPRVNVTVSSLTNTQEEVEIYVRLLLSADCIFGEATSALVEAKILDANVFLLDFSELGGANERHLKELCSSGFIETLRNPLQLRDVIKSTSNRENPNRKDGHKNWHSRVICNSQETSKVIVNYMVSMSKQEKNG
jgi:hypothetical protein